MKLVIEKPVGRCFVIFDESSKMYLGINNTWTFNGKRKEFHTEDDANWEIERLLEVERKMLKHFC